MRAALVLLAVAGIARADDDFAGATIIFARGGALLRTDAKGKGEAELAKLPDKAVVRALRTDAGGSVLLADLSGTWSWLPLDGSTTTLAELPCADGPAQLAEDGLCVLCRAKPSGPNAAERSIIVNLATGKVTPVDVPAPGARLAGVGAQRMLVWADKGGVWTAPPGKPKQAKKVAPAAPLRGFSPSPDGARAVGVFADEVFTDAHHKQPAEVLMGFALDGEGARRKGIKGGVAVEWSHDAQWVLVQNAAEACLMRALGGQYKCWKGYTAVSVASDGKYALILGNRDGSKKQTAPKPAPTEAEDEPAPPDVAVPPPAGPLALYRAQLEGAFTSSPALVVKIVDGAAVWVPGKP